MKKKLRAIVEDSHFFELIKWELESFELSLSSWSYSKYWNREYGK